MKTTFFTLFIWAVVFTSTAQDSATTKFNIKDYSLKDYVAPDIKYKRFDAYLDLSGGGFDETGVGSGNLAFSFKRYVNTTDKQAQSIAGIRSSSVLHWSAPALTNYNTTNNLLYYNSQRRIYNGKESFWGIHNMIDYQYFGQFVNEEDTVLAYRSVQRNVANLTVYLSHGKGRIEPVASARKAMDILISLDKYNRLAKTPDASMVDSLARIANRVTYKRFFDKRFKRVYQLDELDKGIQGLGLVSDPDMIYSANLSDIWDFAFDFNRGSGQRIEYGIIPLFKLVNEKRVSNPNSFSAPTDQTIINYGAFGFASWNKLTPLSYKWQSDIMIDLTAGWQQSQMTNSTDSPSDNIGAMVNLSWSLGYYPTTRTYMAITPFLRMSIGDEANSSEFYGAFTGMDFRSYFYVSPRFRIQVSAYTGYGSDDFNYFIPTPFWNTSANTLHAVTTKTDVITSPNLLENYSSIRSFTDGFQYQARITFNYAIF